MANIDLSLFKPELVFFDLEAESAELLFEKLNIRLKKLGYVGSEWLLSIKKREKNYPTGLACQAIQVAIPHTDPEFLKKPYIAVIKPKKPVIFKAMGEPDQSVYAELIVNLGLMQHAVDEVAVLQALVTVFMNKEACCDILSQSTQNGMVETMVKYCKEA